MSINAFPQSIQAIVQNGILERTFQEALVPNLVYRTLATPRPFQNNLGEKVTFTRKGLLTPVTTALTPGTDPNTANYGFEQYDMILAQYGNSMDTNMLSSATALASKFLEDNQTLAFNAGQSLNQIARNKLYNAYTTGQTYAVGGAATSSTTMQLNSLAGFTSTVINTGVSPESATDSYNNVPVSVGNPLSITINGVANTITGVNTGNSTVTLGTAATWADGDAVISANAPVILRPNARLASNKIVSSDQATLSVFLDAVKTLRTNNVPSFGGYYTAMIDPTTERQLFADSDFKQALMGRVESPIWQTASIGRFSGIDWVRTTEAPTVAGTAGVTVHRPIVVGADALIEGPLEGFGSLLAGTAADRPGIVTMVNGIALIHRPPMDRLQQILSSTWSWVGDFAVPTDILTGSAAQYKRAVVVEHAG